MKRKHQRAASGNVNLVPASLVSHVRNDHRVTSLYEAVWLDHNLIESLEVARIEAHRLVDPFIDACEPPPRSGPIKLHVGVCECLQGSDVAPRVGVKGLTYHLDLRHRLPRQPHGFEGLLVL